jgi:hypothetical protein
MKECIPQYDKLSNEAKEYKLDSNAIAFTSRSIRDNATPTMRRRVRGTEVAAGKGELEMLRVTVDAWINIEEGGDNRAPWNQRQRENMKNVCNLINDWKRPSWSNTYKDTSKIHPIFIVDSHQMKDDGKFSGRYKKMTPCTAFVTANEIADKVCSNVLGGVEGGGNLMLRTMEPPPDINHPPNTMRFYFSHTGQTMNGDTPTRIESLVRETLWLAAANTQEQGRLLRMVKKINLTAELIGRKGSCAMLCRHTAKSHTQNWYRDDEYRANHNNFGNVPVVEGKEKQEELSLMCSWCKSKEGGSLEKGNMRHLHLYCENEHMRETRYLVNDILEEKVKVFLTDAVRIQEQSQLPTNLALRINMAMHELPINDCRLKDDQHDRNPEGARITLSTCEWIAIKNNTTHRLHLQANRWPNLSSCGLMTSRGEEEWNYEYTCSGSWIN